MFAVVIVVFCMAWCCTSLFYVGGSMMDDVEWVHVYTRQRVL